MLHSYSLMQKSWSNFNLRSPDAYLVLSYLIATVILYSMQSFCYIWFLRVLPPFLQRSLPHGFYESFFYEVPAASSFGLSLRISSSIQQSSVWVSLVWVEQCGMEVTLIIGFLENWLVPGEIIVLFGPCVFLFRNNKWQVKSW